VERSQQTPVLGIAVAVMAALPWREETGAPVCERFILLEELGKGSCGVVYKARDVETQELVAVKVLPLTQSVRTSPRSPLPATWRGQRTTESPAASLQSSPVLSPGARAGRGLR